MTSRIPRKINFRLFETYLKMNGNLKIPLRFVTPTGPGSLWPEELQNYNLGNLVHQIRQHVSGSQFGNYDSEDLKKLESLGLTLGNVLEQNDIFLLRALKKYNKLFGHCDLPCTYEIGTDDNNWPKEFRGFTLGRSFSSLRLDFLHKSIRQEVSKIGYDLNPQHDFDAIFDGLVAFKAMHHHVYVPQNFVVEVGDENFPQNTWGMKLGRNLSNIRLSNYWPEHKERLEALGVDFSVKPKPHYGFDSVFATLKAYKAINGNLMVGQYFVVPDEDDRYPSSTWNMKLGSVVDYIVHRGGHSEHKKELLDLGVVYDIRHNPRFEAIFDALVVYKRIYGHLNMTRVYRVPSNSSDFPEPTWGLKLGYALSRIQHGKHYARYRDRLEAIGVNYNDEKWLFTPVVEVD